MTGLIEKLVWLSFPVIVPFGGLFFRNLAIHIIGYERFVDGEERTEVGVGERVSMGYTDVQWQSGRRRAIAGGLLVLGFLVTAILFIVVVNLVLFPAAQR